MSDKTVDLSNANKCMYCHQSKKLRKLGTNYRVNGKLVNYSKLLAECFPNHWSLSKQDGYLCLSCIPKLRAALRLRRMILRSHDLNHVKHDRNSIKNCDETLININDKDDEELVLIENRYASDICNSEEAESILIKNCIETSKSDDYELVGRQYLEIKDPSSISEEYLDTDFNENYNYNQEFYESEDQYDKTAKSTDLETLDIIREEYLDSEYIEPEFIEEDEIHQDNYNQNELDNDKATKMEDILLLNVKETNNECIGSEISEVTIDNTKIPNSTEDILILHVEEQASIKESIYSDCHEDEILNTNILQSNLSDNIENQEKDEEILILQVEDQKSDLKGVDVFENSILGLKTDDNMKISNNMEIDITDCESKEVNIPAGKQIRTPGKKLYRQISYTEDDLKSAVIAIKEGRLTLTQAIKQLKINLRTFHKKTMKYFGASFNRKEKNWDYRQYFKEIVTILNMTNCTPFKTRGNNLYCVYCGVKHNDGVGFTPVQLREHVAKQHRAPTYERVKGFMYPINKHELLKVDIENLECTKCAIKIESWTEMLTHLKDIHEKDINDGKQKIIPYNLTSYKCHFCTQTFANFIKTEAHMNKHFPNYLCMECGESFAAKFSIRYHKRLLHNHNRVIPKKFYCDKCGKAFPRKDGLQIHIHRKHSTQPGKKNLQSKWSKIYECPVCELRFDRLKSLSEHQEKQAHGIEKPCAYCQMVFFSDLAYRDHSKEHAKDEHACDICKTTYKHLIGLKNHMKRVHLDDIYYECEVCKYRFGSKNYLSKHQKRKHYDVWISKREVLKPLPDGTLCFRLRKDADDMPKNRQETDT